MIPFIKSVIEQFGGRIAGSQEEHDAQLFVQEEFAKYCDKVDWHEFEAAITGKFSSLKIFCITYLISNLLYGHNVVLGSILALINTILFIGYFVNGQNWLDFLFKKKKSWNVTGSIEPIENVQSTIIVAGHIDSVWEFQWWYKLKSIGGLLTTLAGILIVLQGLIFTVSLILSSFDHTLPKVFYVIKTVFLILTPVLITFFFIHGKHKVDGAIDNLTGVAMALEMAKNFSKNKLKYTRLKVVSFGSEETGLRGSHEYVKEHLELLKQENALLLNIDTIKNLEDLTIVDRETNMLVKYPEDVIHRMEEAFSQNKVKPTRTALPIGATDGASFDRAGLPAISIIALTTKKFDPSYHTRLDTIEYLDPRGINKLKEILITFIENWDRAN